MVHICPRCRRRFTASLHVTDFEHECNSGDATRDQEDVVVLGTWSDYTGSGTVQASHLMTAGLSDELRGTDAHILGARFDGTTDRGNRSSTHRQRQHIEYIKLK